MADDSEEFNVYYLKDARWVHRDNCWHYTVRWAPPYTEDDNGREPEYNLSCDDLLERFWKQFGGPKTKLTRRQHIFRSSKEWIAKEKRSYLLLNSDTVPSRPVTPMSASTSDYKRKPSPATVHGLFSSSSASDSPPVRTKEPAKRLRGSEDASETGTSKASTKGKKVNKKRRLKAGSRGSTPGLHRSTSKDAPKSKGKGKARAIPQSTPTPPAAPANPLAQFGTPTVDLGRGRRSRASSTSSSQDNMPLSMLFEDTRHGSSANPSVPEQPEASGSSKQAQSASVVEPQAEAKSPPARSTSASSQLRSPKNTLSATRTLEGASSTTQPNPSSAAPSGLRRPVASNIPGKIDKHRGSKVLMMDAPMELAATVNATKSKLFSTTTKPQQGTRPETFMPSKTRLQGLAFKKKTLDPTPPISTSGPSIQQAEAPRPADDWGAQPAISPVLNNPWLAEPIAHSPSEDVTMAEVDPLDGMQTSPFQGFQALSIEPTAQAPLPDPDAFLDEMASQNPALFGEATWSGELTFSAGGASGTLSAEFKQATVPSDPRVPHFKVLLLSSKVVLERTFRILAFRDFIEPAFTAPFQYAAVRAASAGVNADRLSGITKYLLDTQRVSMAILRSNGRSLSYSLVFFPSEAVDLCVRWQVPEDLTGLQNTLVVALVKKITEFPLSFDSPHIQAPQLSHAPAKEIPAKCPSALIELLGRPLYRRAMSMLSISLSTLLGFREQVCCFFPDEQEKDPDADSSALSLLLRAVKTRIVESRDPAARIFFIHAKGFQHLESFRKLHERRQLMPLAFYTYGWDTHRSPQLGGLRSIFKFGGVITFTARAILEDPSRVEEVITRAQTEPFWDVYLHPLVVAMVDELANESPSNANGLSDKHNFLAAFTSILLSQSGERALICSQPPEPHERSKWVSWFLGCDTLSAKDPVVALKECKKLLFDKFPKPRKASSMETDQGAWQWGVPPTSVAGNSGGWGFSSTPSTTESGGWGPAPAPDIDWSTPSADAGTRGSAPVAQKDLWTANGNSSTRSDRRSSNPWSAPQQTPASAGGRAGAPSADTTISRKPVGGLERWGDHASKEEMRNLEAKVEDDVADCLKKLQLQPALMTSYRRFVLVTDNRNGTLKQKHPQVEIAPLGAFTFGQLSCTRGIAKPTSAQNLSLVSPIEPNSR